MTYKVVYISRITQWPAKDRTKELTCMNCNLHNEISELAEASRQRLTDAKVLLNASRGRGAMPMAGYWRVRNYVYAEIQSLSYTISKSLYCISGVYEM